MALRFNLVIENLLFSTLPNNADRLASSLCFNLVIENLLFSTTQMRANADPVEEGFNLVIENLLFSTAPVVNPYCTCLNKGYFREHIFFDHTKRV